VDSENWSTKAAVEKRLPHFETDRHDVSADMKGDGLAVPDQLGVTTARHYEYKHSNVITRPSRAATQARRSPSPCSDRPIWLGACARNVDGREGSIYALW